MVLKDEPSVVKVHFYKMLFVTLTFEPMTLKSHQSHADKVISKWDKSAYRRQMLPYISYKAI